MKASPLTLEDRDRALRELQEIPGVGPSIARDLLVLGIRRVSDLRRRDPETLYRRFEAHVGMPVDRCFLYVMRCAVYYAGHERRDPRLLQWWNWKDSPPIRTKRR